MPSRTRTGAGYDSTAVAASMIHGLLSGSRGTYAAEPLREDVALRRVFFAIPVRVAHHARQMQAQLYSTSNRLRASFSAALIRLAAC